jgi:predicted CopG family antitoxin
VHGAKPAILNLLNGSLAGIEHYMETITISDETYRKLAAVKSGRSFSETINGLISANVNTSIDHLLEISASSKTAHEKELLKVVQGIRNRTRARTAKT